MNPATLKSFATEVRKYGEGAIARIPKSQAGAHAPHSLNSVSAEPHFYTPDPNGECINALGHLTEHWSVVRVVARVSVARASDLSGPSLNAQSELWDINGYSLSIARLGSGDQTIVFPSPDASAWSPAHDTHQVTLLKRGVSNTPVDAMLVQRFGAIRKGPSATVWLVDHLGLPQNLEFDLHRVLSSMKPLHQAVFMGAISRPDIEHKLSSPSGCFRLAGLVVEHTLSHGIRAAMGLGTLDLKRDEASLARLACLLSDLGTLRTAKPSAGSNRSGSGLPGYGDEHTDSRRAHPQTANFLGSLLSRFAALDSQNAAHLQGLLGAEAHHPFRIGSKQGPLGKNPVDPVLARMGCAMGDALSFVRRASKIKVQSSLLSAAFAPGMDATASCVDSYGCHEGGSPIEMARVEAKELK
jgi:hypothetical protein